MLDFGGNLVDALLLASRAALADLRCARLRTMRGLCKAPHPCARPSPCPRPSPSSVLARTRSLSSLSRLPNVTVRNPDSESPDIEISDDPDDVRAFSVATVPVGVTLSRLGRSFVVDATPAEEHCCDASVLVTVTSAGQVSLVQKGGPGSLYAGSLVEMIAVRGAVRRRAHASFGSHRAALSSCTLGWHQAGRGARPRPRRAAGHPGHPPAKPRRLVARMGRMTVQCTHRSAGRRRECRAAMRAGGSSSSYTKTSWEPPRSRAHTLASSIPAQLCVSPHAAPQSRVS